MRVIVTVRIGSLMLVNSELEQLEVADALGAHRRCVLEFTRDRDTDLQLEDLLEGPLTVEVSDDLGAHAIFDGDVVDVAQEHFVHSGSRFHVEGLSRSAHLDRHRSSAIYRDVDYRDVLRKLGVTLASGVPAGEKATFHQAGTTDFEFIARLAFDNGCMTRSEGDGVEVRRGFATKIHEVTWGDTLLGIRVEARPVNHGVKGAAAQALDQKDHRFHGVRVTPAMTAGGSKIVSATRRLAGNAAGGGDPQLVVDQHRGATLSAFRKQLELESERIAGGSVVLSGNSTAGALRAGDQVDLAGSDHFELPTTGRFGLVQVVHRFSDQLYQNDFVAVPWANFSALEPPAAARTMGLVTAVVTNNDDPQHWGRLQVRFPWLNEGEATSWVRVITPYAGNERGIQWLPEITDEVIVAFEQGDPERPYVIGAAWNGLAGALPTPSVKRLVSRHGNSIVLTDLDGKDEVAIYSSQGKVLVGLSNDGTPTLTLHSEGDISIEAGGQLRIKAASLVEKVAGASYRESADFMVKAKGALLLKAAKEVALEASMNVRVAAGMVMESVGGTLNQVIGTLVHLQPPSGPQTRPAKITAPSAPASRWSQKPVPKETRGSTSSDPQTPRGRKR